MSHARKKASGTSLVAERHWPEMELEFGCGLVRRVWSDLDRFADPWYPDTLQAYLTGRTQGLGRCLPNQCLCFRGR